MKRATSLSDPPNYSVLPDKDGVETEFIHVRVDDGSCAGMVFNYNTIRLGREFANGDVPMTFNYEIHNKPNVEASRTVTDEVVASILFDIVKCTTDISEK